MLKLTTQHKYNDWVFSCLQWVHQKEGRKKMYTKRTHAYPLLASATKTINISIKKEEKLIFACVHICLNFVITAGTCTLSLNPSFHLQDHIDLLVQINTIQPQLGLVSLLLFFFFLIIINTLFMRCLYACSVG